MPIPGPDRITVERFVEGVGNVGHAWAPIDDDPTMWATVEPQGQATYRFRIRYRDDLLNRADTEPAMRVIYRGDVYDLDDVVEAIRRREIHLIASRRIVDEIDHLATGTRRIKSWP